MSNSRPEGQNAARQFILCGPPVLKKKSLSYNKIPDAGFLKYEWNIFLIKNV